MIKSVGCIIVLLFLYILLSVCFLQALSTLLFLHCCLGVHGPVSLSPFSRFSCVHQPVCFPISCWLHAEAWFRVSCFFLPSTSSGLQSVSVVALQYLLVMSTSLFVFWLRLICWLCPPVCLCFGSVLFASCVQQPAPYLLVVSNSLLLFLPDVFAGMVQLPVSVFSLLFAGCVFQEPAPVFALCSLLALSTFLCQVLLCYLLAVASD